MVDHLVDDKGGRGMLREATTLARPLEATLGDVVFNRHVGGPYRHLALAAAPSALAARPGQFFQLLCPGQGQGTHTLRRPMSVYRINRAQGTVEFLYKVLGAGTTGLSQLVPGDALDMFGPLGKGFRLDAGWPHVVLLARGVGLATLAPLAEAAVAQDTAVTAILSAANPALVMSEGYLRGVGAEVVVVTDSDGSSAPESLEALLRGLIVERGTAMLATCGSNRLLALVRKLGREFRIHAQVALEEHMACGIGMCYCCVRPFRKGDQVEVRRVCYEGPVFDAQEVLSW